MSTLVGFGGLPDDLQTWQHWFTVGMQVINFGPVRVVLAAVVILGVAVTVYKWTASPGAFGYLWRGFVFSNQVHSPLMFIQKPSDSMRWKFRIANLDEDCEDQIVDTNLREPYPQKAWEVKVNPNSRYLVDYNLDYPYRQIQLIRCIGSFHRESDGIQIRLQVKDAEGGDHSRYWLRVVPGSGTTERVSDRFWLIYVIPHYRQGWQFIDIDVQKVFSQTFGKTRCQLVGVAAIRLATQFAVAEISMRGVSTWKRPLVWIYRWLTDAP